MKFQSLISRVSVVLFAAALTMTSCTKDENLIPNLESNGVSQVEPTIEEVVVGNWTAKTFSNTSGVTFNDRTGSSDKSGLFTIEADGVEYSDFSWSVLPASPEKAKFVLELSYGSTSDMRRSYDILNYSADLISLSSTEGNILLQK